ncbi:hypothetical protein N9893_03010 [bacterium]|nr:hypothetical protein [bacterium]
MKNTAAGDIDRTRDIALQQDLLILLIDIRIGNRRQQCFGIRVQGIGKYAAGISHFNNFAQVHDDDAMGKSKLQKDKKFKKRLARIESNILKGQT